MEIVDAMKFAKNTPENEVILLLCHILKCSKMDLYIKKPKLTSEQECEFVCGIKKLENSYPLQYLLGEWEFFGIPLKIKEGVLIPRQDTEILVEEVLKIAKNGDKILDICTGSGAIAIALAVNSHATVKALDISEFAINLARENANINNVNISIEKMDILNCCPMEKYNIVVSNPPYIESNFIDKLDKNVKDFEPELALNGGIDGLDFYRRIASLEIVVKGGYLAFEIGCTQGLSVKSIMENNKYNNVKIVKDLAGLHRVVIGVKM